jgi:hypothetical protein
VELIYLDGVLSLAAEMSIRRSNACSKFVFADSVFKSVHVLYSTLIHVIHHLLSSESRSWVHYV